MKVFLNKVSNNSHAALSSIINEHHLLATLCRLEPTEARNEENYPDTQLEAGEDKKLNTKQYNTCLGKLGLSRIKLGGLIDAHQTIFVRKKKLQRK